MKMSGKDAATLVIVLGVCGYSYYGSETGTGPIGWLNYAQQAIFGSYSWKGSLLLALCLMGGLVVLVEFGWKKVSGSTDDGEQGVGSRILFGPRATPSIGTAPQKPATSLAAQGKILLQTAVIVVIATWAIGFAVYWSYEAEQREDASAQYEPIDLSDGAPLHQPRGSHIALSGSVQPDAALAHTTESGGTTREDYQLVPISSRGSDPDEPFRARRSCDNRCFHGPDSRPGTRSCCAGVQKDRCLARRAELPPAPGEDERWQGDHGVERGCLHVLSRVLRTHHGGHLCHHGLVVDHNARQGSTQRFIIDAAKDINTLHQSRKGNNDEQESEVCVVSGSAYGEWSCDFDLDGVR